MDCFKFKEVQVHFTYSLEILNENYFDTCFMLWLSNQTVQAGHLTLILPLFIIQPFFKILKTGDGHEGEC